MLKHTLTQEFSELWRLYSPELYSSVNASINVLKYKAIVSSTSPHLCSESPAPFVGGGGQGLSGGHPPASHLKGGVRGVAWGPEEWNRPASQELFSHLRDSHTLYSVAIGAEYSIFPPWAPTFFPLELNEPTKALFLEDSFSSPCFFDYFYCVELFFHVTKFFLPSFFWT